MPYTYPSSIIMMEDHNRAYNAWKRLSLKGKVLIHIDAHIDFAWVASEDPGQVLNSKTVSELDLALKRRISWNLSAQNSRDLINIGNYIYPAIKEGIVEEFYWVVPDPFWDNALERRELKKILFNLKRLNPQDAGDIKIRPDRMEGSFLGVKIEVLKLSALRQINEGGLLDIDTDFMLTSSIRDEPPYFSRKNVLPWILPKELAERIRQKIIRPDVITIAYSVEGGFTPLGYKHLGDELRHLLGPLSPDDGKISAAYYYNLSRACKEKGMIKDAAGHLSKAMELDPSFKTEYNNDGLRFERQRRFNEARREFEFALEADPLNIYARLGLSRLALKSGDLRTAEGECEKALLIDPESYPANMQKADIFMRLKKWPLALKAYQKTTLLKDEQPQLHFILGKLYHKNNELDKAIDEYRLFILSGFDSFAVRLRIAYLYVQKRNFYKARKEIKRAFYLLFKAAPLAILRRMKKVYA